MSAKNEEEEKRQDKDPDYEKIDLRQFRVPVWCPMCNGPMKGKSTSAYYSFGVCVTCFIMFVDGREEKWKSGWRPSDEQVAAYIKQMQNKDED